MSTKTVYRSDLPKEELEIIYSVTLRVKEVFNDEVTSYFDKKGKFDIALLQKIMIASIMNVLGIGLTITCFQVDELTKEKAKVLVEEITNVVIYTMSHATNQEHQLNLIMENCLGKQA